MSRGGARWGAGRPSTKAIGERLPRVDVREWSRRGALYRHGSFVWSWRCGGEPFGSVSVGVSPGDAVTLDFSLTTNGERRAVSQRVRLDRTPCRFGGWQSWFSCPCCGRRVAVLYLPFGRFACRTCQRVAYASQSEDLIGRMWRRQAHLEARLGGSWQRPRGMHRRTYARLLRAVVECEERKDAAIEQVAAQLFASVI